MFYRLGKNRKGAGNHSPPPSAPLYVQGLTSLGDNIQPNCGFIDPSLTFLQSYVIEECALQVTAGEQNKELASNLLLWSPKTRNYGKRRVGRPAITYIDQLCRDTGCLSNDPPCFVAGPRWMA